MQPHIRERLDTIVRRDLQRYLYLARRDPVPVTAILDEAFQTWDTRDWDDIAGLERLFALELRGCYARLAERLRRVVAR